MIPGTNTYTQCIRLYLSIYPSINSHTPEYYNSTVGCIYRYRGVLGTVQPGRHDEHRRVETLLYVYVENSCFIQELRLVLPFYRTSRMPVSCLQPVV